MSVEILALCGSPRRDRSRTAWLVQSVLTEAKNRGANITYIDVASSKINPCLACDRCHHLGYCVQKDDFSQIFEKISAADGIVLGSPVYIYQVTAQLKMFIDRLGNAIHCQRLAGKYGAVVTTAGGAGHEETALYLEQLIGRLGAQYVGRVAGTLDDGPVDPGSTLVLEAKALGARLVEAITAKEEYPDQVQAILAQRGYFREVIGRRGEDWPWEYRFWQEKGWL